MLFGGVPGAMNARQDTGMKTPIDASRYVTLSFRVKRSWAAGNTEALKVLLGEGPARRGDRRRRLLLLAKGYDNDTARWINQNPIGNQGDANEWQVYRVRLTDPRVLAAEPLQRHAVERPRSWASASDAGHGSRRLHRAGRLGAAHRRPHGVALDWQSLGGNVVVTATDGTQTVQVFPEDLTPLANPRNPRSDTGAFPDNSSVTWDYGHLTPGTWTITARGAGATRTATLVVDASPFFTVLNPDETGGEDMATHAHRRPLGPDQPRGRVSLHARRPARCSTSRTPRSRRRA